MVVSGRPVKRAKRRVTADLYDFLTFPSAGDGAPGDFDGPFRSNVRAFVTQQAQLPHPHSILSPLLASNLMTWRMAFRVGEAAADSVGGDTPAAVELDVVEEDVPRSRSVYCDQCRVVGWSGHPVCGKRYHFIIRNGCSPTSGYQQPCTRCGTLMHLSDLRCASCNYEMTAEDIEDWVYLQLESSSHLLHGVVHANGYGHLLRVNGREGGSKYLTGSDIIAFWDRLCKMLRVRKVTVMDISKKYGLQYRLLHAVTSGCSWYGEWGYEFVAGSYGVTAEIYKKAVDTLSNVPISLFFPHARSPRTRLQDIIALYSSLSDHQLSTLRDLFQYVMVLLHDARVQTQPKSIDRKEKVADAASGLLSLWNKDDIDRAENVIVKVLRAVRGPQWVTLRALRGATCRSVASPELLDYCLKGLAGRTLDCGMIVAVRCCADTSAIQYRLEAVSDQPLSPKFPCRPSEGHLLKDLRFLYDSLLNPEKMDRYKPVTMRNSAIWSAERLLDCKQFIKCYDEPASQWMSSNPFRINVWCRVEVIGQPKDCTAPPPELIIIPVTATVADLKSQASRSYRETYLMFQDFQAEQLSEYGHVGDGTHVKLLLGLNGVVTIRGSLLSPNGVVRVRGGEQRLWNFRMERGPDNWKVDCSCGAMDDDGERMMACDICGVWQHTRCSGISDYEEAPSKFVCMGCNAFCKPRGRANIRCKDNNSTSGLCKEDISTSCIVEERFDGGLTSVG